MLRTRSFVNAVYGGVEGVREQGANFMFGSNNPSKERGVYGGVRPADLVILLVVNTPLRSKLALCLVLLCNCVLVADASKADTLCISQNASPDRARLLARSRPGLRRVHHLPLQRARRIGPAAQRRWHDEPCQSHPWWGRHGGTRSPRPLRPDRCDRPRREPAWSRRW